MIPVPENATDAPLTKFVPVIVTLKAVAPLSPALGLVEVTLGPCVVTELLAPLCVDHERHTAVTS